MILCKSDSIFMEFSIFMKFNYVCSIKFYFFLLSNKIIWDGTPLFVELIPPNTFYIREGLSSSDTIDIKVMGLPRGTCTLAI